MFCSVDLHRWYVSAFAQQMNLMPLNGRRAARLNLGNVYDHQQQARDGNYRIPGGDLA